MHMHHCLPSYEQWDGWMLSLPYESSFMAQTISGDCTTHLPLVMHGILMALKQDLGCFSADPVNGSTLCLPGEFFPFASTVQVPQPHTYVESLCNSVPALQPTPPWRDNQTSTFINKELNHTSHVFIRHLMPLWWSLECTPLVKEVIQD